MLTGQIMLAVLTLVPIFSVYQCSVEADRPPIIIGDAMTDNDATVRGLFLFTIAAVPGSVASMFFVWLSIRSFVKQMPRVYSGAPT
ncbi:hypothetical protein ASF39_03380 [Methylobacterium sp. Leaf108]|nr:hypothetical protein ASF39_03380 [Methylobacterium sp. Leaf108]